LSFVVKLTTGDTVQEAMTTGKLIKSIRRYKTLQM